MTVAGRADIAPSLEDVGTPGRLYGPAEEMMHLTEGEFMSSEDRDILRNDFWLVLERSTREEIRKLVNEREALQKTGQLSEKDELELFQASAYLTP